MASRMSTILVVNNTAKMIPATAAARGVLRAWRVKVTCCCFIASSEWLCQGPRPDRFWSFTAPPFLMESTLCSAPIIAYRDQQYSFKTHYFLHLRIVSIGQNTYGMCGSHS